MAAWQYGMKVIPKNFITSRYEDIPSEISLTEIDKANLLKFWKEHKINLDELVITFSEILINVETNNLSYFYWKSTNKDKKGDADIYLQYDKDKKVIQELFFRFDLRDKSLIFLNEMIEICLQNEWLLLDEIGNVFVPNLNKISKSIKFWSRDKKNIFERIYYYLTK